MRRVQETGRGTPAGRRDPSSRAGFSLVEVTLALLVVAVGMTAAFALFPEAIRSTRAAQDNTETALFADYVFSTLDLTAGYKSLGGNINANDLPGAANDNFISLSFSQDANDSNFEIHTGGPHRFYWMPDYFGVAGGDEMSASYFKGELKTAVFTYTLKLKEKAGGGTPFVAVLKVWPGEYADGITETELSKQPPRVFYREILPPK